MFENDKIKQIESWNDPIFKTIGLLMVNGLITEINLTWSTAKEVLKLIQHLGFTTISNDNSTGVDVRDYVKFPESNGQPSNEDVDQLSATAITGVQDVYLCAVKRDIQIDNFDDIVKGMGE